MITTAKTTVNRAEINRRNAQKSTGPRTPEGKERAKFNAVKHGMTAKTLVLPGEDADAHQLRLENWTADLQPQNGVEQFLVEQAVQSSWKIERADRAEAARLSHIIESVPQEEANRQQDVIAALGDWLLSDRDVIHDLVLRRDLLDILAPDQKRTYPDCRTLDIFNHPEAIVRRLETTATGCQWLLDRWTELRATLDLDCPWGLAEKARALRLLGKRPLNLEPGKWEVYIQGRDDGEAEMLEELVDRQLDSQLDERLAVTEPTTPAVFRGIADQAIARLETLVAGHRRRAESDAQQAARLSFDASNDAERLRRYQFSCGRSLFRSLDTLIKVRRSGLKLVGGEAAEENASRDGDDAAPVVRLEIPREPQAVGGFPAEIPDIAATTAENPAEQTAAGAPVVPVGGIVESSTENEPNLTTCDCEHSQNETIHPPVNGEHSQNEPTTGPMAAIAPREPPVLGAAVLAMTLIVLSGAGVGDSRKTQNEPITAARGIAGGSPAVPATSPTGRGKGLLVSSGAAPMTAVASPLAVSIILTEPSVSDAGPFRYNEIDSIERLRRLP